MHNITKINHFQNILKKKVHAISLTFSQKFVVSATLSYKRKYFINPPEGLVPEPEEKKESEENKNSVSYRRNISGLQSHHYKRYHKQCPDYTEDEKEVMELYKYRKLYGWYGNSANIDLRTLWPSVYEMNAKKERERIEFPHTVHEMITMAREERLQEEKAIMDNQLQIVQNMKKLENWQKGVSDRMAKKEKEAQDLLAIKERQIEEVREILGFSLSSNDPKFQEVLEKKLEEDKKIAKKEKKLKRQKMEIQRLTEMVHQEVAEVQSAEDESSQKGNVNK